MGNSKMMNFGRLHVGRTLEGRPSDCNLQPPALLYVFTEIGM